MSAVEKRLARGLRVLREDLWTGKADPLPPSVWLRWLPHGLVILVAIGSTIANADQFGDGYNLGTEYALVCALAQGAAVGLALRWPVPAWQLSMVVTVVVAMGARTQLIADHAAFNSPWPWGPPGLVAHAVVLFLLALRVPTRVAAEVFALTALVTWVVQGIIGAANYSSTGMLAVALFAGVILLGSAQRGRREARTQLVEQAGITAEERARRTVLEERNRIARELHDVVAHHMSVISIQAQVAPHLVENPSDELRENLDGIRQNALEALTELRHVLGVLRSENPEDPYGIGAPGTGAAPDAPQPTLDRLDVLVDNTRAAGMKVNTEISGEVLPLPPGVELSAYRIIQEALSNALRHAPGSEVRVELTHFPRGLQIRVINSAPRRPAPPSPGAGHGLLGMRERAAMLGGTLMATETSGGGFTVAAFLPRAGTATLDASAHDDSTPDQLTPDHLTSDHLTSDNSTDSPGERS
ncbi:sensor histidine kinase [Streptomyces ureilyticus]|uniref:histidine kinase n=1 Tax=Streptomyces ureilyticus TaxID=1775131 RepID=A0ABX0E0A7_9ACTN|nr:sensor histidine kinase [Streptomyces ureilyticus]NGO47637.1 sensor histidine kinase [Streptomyces ureilyticus]